MISKSLIAASTKPMLLTILLNGESYGYQIIQRVRSLSGGMFKWSDGMLYPVLHRLERDGLITSPWRISDGERPRKYYTLTEKGREAWAAIRIREKTSRPRWSVQNIKKTPGSSTPDR